MVVLVMIIGQSERKQIIEGCRSMAMGNRIIRKSTINKTIRYLKKNGIGHAFYAVRERIEEEKRDDYHYVEPSKDLLEAQSRETEDLSCLFSIVVPAYETKQEFLREMIDSVRRQSYGRWELILIDASPGSSVEAAVKKVMEETGDSRIRYRHLGENKGISGNTNAGIMMAQGDYIALLDHDDLIAPDALYHMVMTLKDAGQQRIRPVMLYTDEDKYEERADGTARETHREINSNSCYISPHRKDKFNLDLILSNNYICHFMAVEAELMKSLQLRGKYDGAQDYDLVLRVVDRLYGTVPVQAMQQYIVHIPKVLYHWRCHAGSTAENTASKSYAYEAGRQALQDFCKKQGWNVRISHSLHLGFYRVNYLPDLLAMRKETGIVGGRILDRHNRICGGAYREDGACLYQGLHKEYSGGSTHRAVLKQDVYAVDIRCMRVCPGLWKVFEEITGLPYRERKIRCKIDGVREERNLADLSGLSCDEAGYRKLSMELGQAAANQGYLVVWDPELTVSAGRD